MSIWNTRLKPAAPPPPAPRTRKPAEQTRPSNPTAEPEPIAGLQVWQSRDITGAIIPNWFDARYADGTIFSARDPITAATAALHAETQQPCPFCGYPTDPAAGKYGCPNCEGSPR